jgi:hypothetical protein
VCAGGKLHSSNGQLGGKLVGCGGRGCGCVWMGVRVGGRVDAACLLGGVVEVEGLMEMGRGAYL